MKADYASIELWVAAVLWEDPHMQRALRQGVNMHVATAAALFNVKPGRSLRSKIRGRITSPKFADASRALSRPRPSPQSTA